MRSRLDYWVTIYIDTFLVLVHVVYLPTMPQCIVTVLNQIFRVRYLITAVRVYYNCISRTPSRDGCTNL